MMEMTLIKSWETRKAKNLKGVRVKVLGGDKNFTLGNNYLCEIAVSQNQHVDAEILSVIHGV